MHAENFNVKAATVALYRTVCKNVNIAVAADNTTIQTLGVTLAY